MAIRFGELLKTLRIRKGITLREFCQLNGFDAANLSRLERGHYPPPQNREKLEAYALALGLVPGTDGWIEFFDVAAAERGELPRDLMSDEELVEKLPILFRTLRAKQVEGKNLDELIDKIRRS